MDKKLDINLKKESEATKLAASLLYISHLYRIYIMLAMPLFSTRYGSPQEVTLEKIWQLPLQKNVSQNDNCYAMYESRD